MRSIWIVPREQRNAQSNASRREPRTRTIDGRSSRWSGRSSAFKMLREPIIGSTDKFRANPQSPAREFCRMSAHEQTVSAKCADGYVAIHGCQISTPRVFFLQQLFSSPCIVQKQHERHLHGRWKFQTTSL